MNGCPEFQDRLVEQALGGEPAPDVAAHLAACHGCARAFEGLRERAAQMEAGLRALAAAEPPARLANRILAAIPRPGLPARLDWRIAIPALGLAAALIISAFNGAFNGAPRRQADVPREAAALAAWRSPTEFLLRSTIEPLLNDTPRLGRAAVTPGGDTNVH